uniref:Packaging terminase large subunit gpA n=1 Tax=uncultured marine virus TaxID=186617 RepID=A0A0F7L2X5_9VIRU|nr:packaging terminase large subunit gpA [uncultured marine virus]
MRGLACLGLGLSTKESQRTLSKRKAAWLYTLQSRHSFLFPGGNSQYLTGLPNRCLVLTTSAVNCSR